MFLGLLLESQVNIHAYILSLVPNYADADDILQQTFTLMWEKFDDFEIGTNFVSWGVRIAHFRILEYWKKRKKDEVVFGNDFVHEMVPMIEAEDKHTSDRIEALKRCLKKLSDRARELVKLRYHDGMRVKDMSNRMGLTVPNIYKSLARINGTLLACVERVVKQVG